MATQKEELQPAIIDHFAQSKEFGVKGLLLCLLTANCSWVSFIQTAGRMLFECSGGTDSVNEKNVGVNNFKPQ